MGQASRLDPQRGPVKRILYTLACAAQSLFHRRLGEPHLIRDITDRALRAVQSDQNLLQSSW
jgi:hypothetical protein